MRRFFAATQGLGVTDQGGAVAVEEVMIPLLLMTIIQVPSQKHPHPRGEREQYQYRVKKLGDQASGQALWEEQRLDS